MMRAGGLRSGATLAPATHRRARPGTQRSALQFILLRRALFIQQLNRRRRPQIRIVPRTHAHTTFLSGVTSSTCTVFGHSFGSFSPWQHQLHITVLPLANRLTSWMMNSLISGQSFCVIPHRLSLRVHLPHALLTTADQRVAVLQPHHAPRPPGLHRPYNLPRRIILQHLAPVACPPRYVPASVRCSRRNCMCGASGSPPASDLLFRHSRRCVDRQHPRRIALDRHHHMVQPPRLNRMNLRPLGRIIDPDDLLLRRDRWPPPSGKTQCSRSIASSRPPVPAVCRPCP